MKPKNIDIEHFKKWLSYNPDTGIFTWKKSPSNAVKKDDIAGAITNNGYIRISIRGKNAFAHRLAWLWYHKEIDKIDHINHNRADNRLINLRSVSHTENQKNQTKGWGKSGFMGITTRNRKRKYQLNVAGNYIGSYYTLEEALHYREKEYNRLNYHCNHDDRGGVLSQN